MKVTSIYFGMIAEHRGVSNEDLDLVKGANLFEVKEKAIGLIPVLKDINYSVAVNQRLESNDIELKEGDEIAFFPPFAGG